MSNSNRPDNNGSSDANDFSSFADFGRSDGLDADTINLFGSFTNDAIQGNIGDLGTNTTTSADPTRINDAALVGSSLTSDLSSFGVDLGALEMGGHATANESSTVDLSSIQLMNIEETPANAASSMHNASAADMVARLLGPGSQGTQQPVAIGSLEQQALGLSMGNGVGQTVESVNKNKNFGAKSRSSSQSSDDMGDIPLAQLALMQQPSDAPSMTPSAAQPPFSQQSNNPGNAAANDSLLSYARTQSTGQIQAQPVQTQAPIAMQMQMQMAAQSVGDTSASAIGGMALGLGESLMRAPVPSDVSAIAQVGLQQPAVAESGSTGVISTVLLQADPSPSASFSQPVAPNLQFDLSRPTTTLEDASLEELEQIEVKLCSLLTTASHATRMMSGPRDLEGQKESEALDLSESKLKPTIREFMLAVAEIQAGMRQQHRLLAMQRIPIHTSAGLHSDVAGFERDLVLWSDAASLLAEAIDTGLDLASST
ncbi:hypothetical protein LPJ64_004743 [Coemansia asiatica]|uniref:Mediator of RNA polymerase II transcription subunit 11 n=1 Tax=Coemansia asiatica TaxID=1052880 RepID=A0A9W7XHQ8_9FUNG|nr:hypothetical protein LPJ64_004743 [Coemansia asiatica]